MTVTHKEILWFLKLTPMINILIFGNQYLVSNNYLKFSMCQFYVNNTLASPLYLMLKENNLGPKCICNIQKLEGIN